MAFLAFNSQKSEVVGPKVADALKNELLVSSAPPFTVAPGDADPTTVGTFLKELGGHVAGAALQQAVGEGIAGLFGKKKEAILFNLAFALPAPKSSQLVVQVARQGIGSHVSSLLYSATLGKAISGAVHLNEDDKFEGDEALAKKLNDNKPLRKRCAAFARTEANVGGMDIAIERFFKLAPGEGGKAVLAAATLPRSAMFGFKVLMDAKEFGDLVAALEAGL